MENQWRSDGDKMEKCRVGGSLAKTVPTIIMQLTCQVLKLRGNCIDIQYSKKPQIALCWLLLSSHIVPSQKRSSLTEQNRRDEGLYVYTVDA